MAAILNRTNHRTGLAGMLELVVGAGPVLLLLSGFFLVLVSLSVSCDGREKAYLDANEALLKEFPSYPGAMEISRRTMGYRFREGPFKSPDGFGTNVTYQLPTDATLEDVIAFFMSNIDSSWRRRLEEPDQRLRLEEPDHIRFCRGDAQVSINAVNVPDGHRYDVYVDHSFAQPGIRGTAC
jgi:hypothetical protein